jgi:uncharacterized membrane protein
MSDEGRIVGICGNRGFEWYGGTGELVVPPGATGTTYVTAVANGGYLAGSSYFGSKQHGWVRRPDGTFTIIRDGAGRPVDWAWPEDVTPAGLVVGWRIVSLDTGRKEAFKWSETLGFVPLRAPGRPWTIARAVNDAGGTVVGEASVSAAAGITAARWTLLGGYSTLPPLGYVARAVDINASTTIVGNDTDDLGLRPITWSSIGTPSVVPWAGSGEGRDITDRGRVTGFVNVDAFRRRPATSYGGVAELIPMPYWAVYGWGEAADACGSVAGTVSNDDWSDGRYAPTIERAVLWRKVGCDR